MISQKMLLEKQINMILHNLQFSEHIKSFKLSDIIFKVITIVSHSDKAFEKNVKSSKVKFFLFSYILRVPDK